MRGLDTNGHDGQPSRKWSRDDSLNLVDEAGGTIDPRVYADDELYALELEHIIGRAWLFIAHEWQIPKTGDFFCTYVGEGADTRRVKRVNIGMGRGRSRRNHPDYPGIIGNVYGEEAARGFYAHWVKMLVSEDWADRYPSTAGEAPEAAVD